MTTPDLRSIMPGRKARSRRTAASRLTSSILCQSSSESPSNPPAFGSQPRRSHDGWLCWLPCRSAPDRVCRAAFDHSRRVMDTCGLERVEGVRINLNEKHFASQKHSLTSIAAGGLATDKAHRIRLLISRNESVTLAVPVDERHDTARLVERWIGEFFF